MTSIEFIVKELILEGYDHIIQQAIEMHKQEIINTVLDVGSFMSREEAEQYYQETFVSKGSDECQFEPTTNTSSATICVNCGREKFLHKF